MRDMLIVDGYNIIHGNVEMQSLFKKNLDDARLRLMEVLSSYASYKGWVLVVVFDAHKVKDNTGSFEQYDRNTHIVFTGKNETADSVIEKMAHDLKYEHIIRVATSDKEQQYYVLTQGAIRISARELWQDIKHTQQQLSASRFVNRSINENDFLQDRINSNIKRQMEKLRRGMSKE